MLRPDRLLIAELMLFGGVRQVPEALWFRRESSGASVDRQRHSLVLAGDEPKWFHTPPWFQHSVVLWETYARPEPPPLPISRTAWRRMLLRYQLTYGWKHFRKTEASHAVGRGIDNVIWTKKITKHYWHHAVYNTLVGGAGVVGQDPAIRQALRLRGAHADPSTRPARPREGAEPVSVSSRLELSDARCTVWCTLSTSEEQENAGSDREGDGRAERCRSASDSSDAKQLDGLSERLSRLALDKRCPRTASRTRRIRAASGRQHRMLSQGLRFAEWKEALRIEERRIRRRIERLARSDRPVLVGPWAGEVGFELLYWVPFVTWALREAAVAPERIVVVSRGGPASWYAHLGGRYIDVLSCITPDEFRSRTEAAEETARRWVRSIARSRGA